MPGPPAALKTKIGQRLKQRFSELFQAEFDVLPFDLTGTYVEGTAEENPMMRRGCSRDHRPDCEHLVLALIVNQDGFAFGYELFDGDRADVTTVEASCARRSVSMEKPHSVDIVLPSAEGREI